MSSYTGMSNTVIEQLPVNISAAQGSDIHVQKRGQVSLL